MSKRLRQWNEVQSLCKLLRSRFVLPDARVVFRFAGQGLILHNAKASRRKWVSADILLVTGEAYGVTGGLLVADLSRFRNTCNHSTKRSIYSYATLQLQNGEMSDIHPCEQNRLTRKVMICFAAITQEPRAEPKRVSLRGNTMCGVLTWVPTAVMGGQWAHQLVTVP